MASPSTTAAQVSLAARKSSLSQGRVSCHTTVHLPFCFWFCVSKRVTPCGISSCTQRCRLTSRVRVSQANCSRGAWRSTHVAWKQWQRACGGGGYLSCDVRLCCHCVFLLAAPPSKYVGSFRDGNWCTSNELLRGACLAGLVERMHPVKNKEAAALRSAPPVDAPLCRSQRSPALDECLCDVSWSVLMYEPIKMHWSFDCTISRPVCAGNTLGSRS